MTPEKEDHKICRHEKKRPATVRLMREERGETMIIDIPSFLLGAVVVFIFSLFMLNFLTRSMV